jgi:hypothetical protein
VNAVAYARDARREIGGQKQSAKVERVGPRQFGTVVRLVPRANTASMTS